jgi:hypothetical protein
MVSSVVAASLPAISAKLPPTSKVNRKVRSRDEAGIDSETDNIPATPLSPTKRLKVSFKIEPEFRKMEDSTEKGAELIEEEVRRGIECYKWRQQSLLFQEGVDLEALYQQAVDIFTTKANAEDAPSPTLIRKYTVALLSQASRLDKSCNALVSAALESDWIGRDKEYIALYIKFLATLVSSQGRWVPNVLNMLVGKLNTCKGWPCFVPMVLTDCSTLRDWSPAKSASCASGSDLQQSSCSSQEPSDIDSIRKCCLGFNST